jgi:hypothetical protein
MTGAQEPEDVYTKPLRIAWQARNHPDRAFTSLAQHIDLAWLHEAYRRTRKQGAAGIDGQSAKDYARQLDANLQERRCFQVWKYMQPERTPDVLGICRRDGILFQLEPGAGHILERVFRLRSFRLLQLIALNFGVDPLCE